MPEELKKRVYHTGYQVIEKPDVHYGRKNADFGQGFYLTAQSEFAGKWAKERKGQQIVLNTYELDLTGLEVQRFTRDSAWFDYIFYNRAGSADYVSADVIIGPIANDTIYDTLGIFTSGILKREEALELLMVGPEYEQIALKTEKAAEQLAWKSARVIEPEEIAEFRDAVAKEQEEYLRTIGTAMENREET